MESSQAGKARNFGFRHRRFKSYLSSHFKRYNMKNKIIELIKQGKTCSEIAEILQKNKSSIYFHYSKYCKPENKRKLLKDFDWKSIQDHYNISKSIKNTAKHFNMSTSTIDKAINTGYLIKVENFDRSQYFVENSPHGRSNVKRYIIKHKLLPYVCAECKMLPMWQNKKLVLVLDHINGINNDNRIENLRFLCPNCNSQMDTFCGRNKQ